MKYKKPTENYSFDQIVDRIAWFAFACVVYGMLVGYLLTERKFALLIPTVIVMLSALYLLGLRWGIVVANHTQGIRGEIKVGAILAQLPKQDFWYAFDVVVPGTYGNIDHVVIGTTGVWITETKHFDGRDARVRNGRLEKDGYPINSKILSTLKANAKQLHTYLTAHGAPVSWVQPVLVFSTDAMHVDVPEQFSGVWVVGFRDVADLIFTKGGNRTPGESEREKIRAILENREKGGKG